MFGSNLTACWNQSVTAAAAVPGRRSGLPDGVADQGEGCKGDRYAANTFLYQLIQCVRPFILNLHALPKAKAELDRDRSELRAASATARALRDEFEAKLRQAHEETHHEKERAASVEGALIEQLSEAPTQCQLLLVLHGQM